MARRRRRRGSIAKAALYGQHGGFDLDLVGEEETKEFVCGICLKILRGPHQTLCCGQHYCETCLERWLEEQGIPSLPCCLHCREPDFKHVPDISVRRKVDALKVYCIYTEEGCEWKGTLSSIKAHLDSQSGCCYVLLSCPNSCGLDLIRKDIQVHLIDECELRTCECKHCGYKDNYNCMSGHYSTCVEYPVPCPEGCSQRMKRKSLERHKIKCPMGQVKCPFSHAGCNKPLNRKDLKNHLKNEVHSHLLLFLGPLEQVRLSVNETRATANTLSVSVNTINTNLSELRAEQLQAKGAAQRYRERLTRVTTDVQNLYTEQFQAKGESQRHRHKLTEVSTQVSTNTKKLEEIDLDLSELHAEQFQAKVKSQRHRHKLTEVSTQVSTNTKKLEEIDHDLSKLRSEQLQAKGESQRLREELTRVSTNTKNLEELLVPPCIIFWLYLVYQFIAYMYYKLYA